MSTDLNKSEIIISQSAVDEFGTKTVACPHTLGKLVACPQLFKQVNTYQYSM
jgi:hypothetical protein